MEVGCYGWTEAVFWTDVSPFKPFFTSLSSFRSLQTNRQKLTSNRYNRTHFDYVILGLLLIYGFSFGMFIFAHMRLKYWIWFFRIVWPCLIATDIFCFVAGWVATWKDVGMASLG